MSAYDKNGNALTDIYDKSGTGLTLAYDKDGNIIFTSNPTSLKVMTYNVGQWFTGNGNGSSAESTSAVNHRTLLQSIISTQDADVMCFQEYWDVVGSATIISMLSETYPYYQEVNGETSYFGHAVFSKYPITNFMTAPLANNPTFTTVAESSNTNRFIDRFNVTVDNTTLTFFNTHFGLTADTRASNADWLLALINAQTNVILCGDLNTGCHSTSDVDYSGVINKFLVNGYHCANCSTFGFMNTYTSESDNMDSGTPCDNIITSSNILIDNAYVDTTKLTDSLSEKIDHIPLIAELSIY